MAEFPVTKPQFIVPSCVNLSTYIQGMSDYEVRCYYSQLVQQWATEWAQMQTEWGTQQEAFESFKTYVNEEIAKFQSWFDNLDVQNEINNKIDEMASDGSLGTIINNTGTVQSATTSWLQQNVTPTGSSVMVDKSLTIEGASADSLAVGNAIVKKMPIIAEPSSTYTDFNTFPPNTYTWIIGSYIGDIKNSPVSGKDACFISISAAASVSNQSQVGNMQIVICDDRAYIRYNSANRWKPWTEIATVNDSKQFIKSASGFTSTPPAPYDDLNTLPNNVFTCYSINVVKNAPADITFPITVIGYNAFSTITDNVNGQTQIVFEQSTATPYARIMWGSSWGPWTKLATSGYVDSAVSNLKSYIDSELSKIPNLTISYESTVYKPLNFKVNAYFCGDSITQGHTGGGVITQQNWPKLLNDKLQFNKYVNYALGGALMTPNVNEVKSIEEQVKDVELKTGNNLLFIAGGVNDWTLSVELDTFEQTIADICDYINTNYSNNYQVVFITPINEGGWPRQGKYSLQNYRDIIMRVAKEKDVYGRFSILCGEEFNFPNADDSESYIVAMFGDKLHPSELGYKSLYLPGVLSKIV